MMPRSGLSPIFVEHANEMGTSETASNQHHVGSRRADHGPKHAPGVISQEGGGFSTHCVDQHQIADNPCRRMKLLVQNA